jgi:hypothetical protein
MASWTTTFDQTVLDIIVLFRNITGRENVTHREKEMIERSVEEALQKICLRKYGTRLRFLEEDFTVDTVSGTATAEIGPDYLHIIQGSMTIDAEDVYLSEVGQRTMDVYHIGTEDTGKPRIYSLEPAASGPGYIGLKFYPIPDAAYTINGTISKIVSSEGFSEFPNYMLGAIMDMATYISMKRVGFGNPAGWKADAEASLDEIASQEGSDGPLHIDRTQPIYRGYRLQERAN